MTSSSSPVHINAAAKDWRFTPPADASIPGPFVQAFHSLYPDSFETPLLERPLADALNVGQVLIKDESKRYGLPSFKILGASWAVYRAVTERLGLDAFTLLRESEEGLELPSLGALARETGSGLKIVTCTEGNWGRAVARMAMFMDIPAVVYVPEHMCESTRQKIRLEKAEVRVADGSYDAAVAAAREAAEADDGSLLVMDISWEGYEAVPQWVVEGYQTMLDEIDTQLNRHRVDGKPLAVTHVIVPVGCGSIAQAVTQHFKSAAREQRLGSTARVLTVEPDTAACFKASLEHAKMTSVATGDSNMCGMNCGTLSTLAWPILQLGVDGAVVVSDGEADDAVRALNRVAIKAGPCGAATLAALRKACNLERARLGLTEESVVVLLNTESARHY